MVCAYGSFHDVASLEACHLLAVAYWTVYLLAPESAVPAAVPSGVCTVGEESEPFLGQRNWGINGSLQKIASGSAGGK